MAFDSEGNFTRLHSWEQDRQNDVGIIASRHDEEDDNFAGAFNNTFCRDGRSVATGNFKMGLNKITGLANGETSNDAVNKGQLDTYASDVTTNMTTSFLAKIK